MLLAYGLYKYIRGTKIIPLTEVPVHQALEEARNDPENVRGLMFCGHEVKNDMLNGETNNMTMHMHR